MAALNEIITGDSYEDDPFFVQLRRDGSSFAIGDSAVVIVSLIYHRTVILGPITLSKDTPGAVWGTSLVALPFTAAQTAAISKTGIDAGIEIEIDDEETFYYDKVFSIRQDTI